MYTAQRDINGTSFNYSSRVSLHAARTIAVALFHSALAIEEFEARERIAQETAYQADAATTAEAA